MDSRPRLRSLNDIFFQDIFIKIIFQMTSFAGIFPCSYENSQFSVSIPLCVWSFLMVCFTIFCTVYFNINLFIPEARVKFFLINTLTQIIVSFWFCFVFLAMYLIAVMHSVVKMRHINRILSVLNEIDRQLAILEIRRGFSQRAKYVAKTYFGGLVMATIYYLNSPLISSAIFIKVFLFLPFFCVWLCTALFTSLADQITFRLDETCIALEDIVLMRHFSFSIRTLITLSQVHDKLCDAYITLDSSNAWLITFVVSSCFNGVFIPFYMLLPSFYTAETGLNLNLIGLAVFWIVFSLYNVWQIASTTSGITTKLRGFNLTLYKHMRSNKQHDLLRNNKLRLHIAMQREVVFNAKGFFKLDFTLIQWIIASATTYLVILIEFTLPGDETYTDLLVSDVN